MKITIRKKGGESFTGTPIECARVMRADANRSRFWDIARPYKITPLPGYWMFEDFCEKFGIRFEWDREEGYLIYEN